LKLAEMFVRLLNDSSRIIFEKTVSKRIFEAGSSVDLVDLFDGCIRGGCTRPYMSRSRAYSDEAGGSDRQDNGTRVLSMEMEET
jgi:hypothetical protein